jgi:hypothetical protein
MSIQRKSDPAASAIRILLPGECSADDLQTFTHLVRQGDQVMSLGLEARIVAAAWLGFAWLEGKIAGVAALKNPLPTYHTKVFSAAGAMPLADRYPLEFGWAVVVPQFRARGIATSLLHELLLKTTTGTFATTNADNQSMRRILQGSGFHVLGRPFRIPRRATACLLWVFPAASGH